MTGYDYIAPFYQFFSKLVFGDLLFEAQTLFLTKDLTPNKILIVGGGTGELLSFCLNQYPAVRITYVESSKKMTSLELLARVGFCLSFLFLSLELLSMSLIKSRQAQ